MDSDNNNQTLLNREILREELRKINDELLKKAKDETKMRTNSPSPVEEKLKKHKSKKSHKKNKKDERTSSSKKGKKKKKDKRSSSPEISYKEKKSRKQSESSTDSDQGWIEKPASKVEHAVKRDDWMTAGIQLKTYTKTNIKSNETEKQSIDSYNPAKCSRELNPYWKNGGNGLPSFQKPRDDESDHRKFENRYPPKSQSGNWRKNKDVRNSTKTSSENDTFTSRTDKPIDEISVDSRKDECPENIDQQMNELGSKIIKAEILGNTSLAQDLKEKLEELRNLRNKSKSSTKDNLKKQKNQSDKDNEEHIVLTKTDINGVTRPLKRWEGSNDNHAKREEAKKARMESKIRNFFPDDDRYDIKQMFEREKYVSAEDSDIQFAKLTAKQKPTKDDFEDIFDDKIHKSMDGTDVDSRDKAKAIAEHEKLTKTLEDCERCFDSSRITKDLIIAIGTNVYLSLPSYEGLQSGHCLIQPMQHISCSTQLDENVWDELNNFRKALTRMFESRSQEVLFFETVRYLNRRPHMVIHCIPGKDFEMAPFYFKKAIQESEEMWSTNKQVISVKSIDIRRSIPKGLPYFWIHFGMDSGLAHVIENQTTFPANFAQEIIGGFLKLDPRTWRHPRREHNIISKVKQFTNWWKPFDCTV